jgi:hypothetical protein
VAGEAGTVVYAPETRVITVSGFPESAPATMDSLLQADQRNGWGLVTYERANATYTVNASLYIGTETDLGTYVQIGRKDHPAETVVMKGDLWIRTPKKSILRSDGLSAIGHRLTLGDPADASIHAALKFACSKPGEYALVMGSRTPRDWRGGGDLHVYNSMIGAMTPSNFVTCSKAFGDDQPCWYAASVRLINARLSWLDGSLYGVQAHNSIIRGTTFEHMRAVLGNGAQYAEDVYFVTAGWRSRKVAVSPRRRCAVCSRTTT